MLIEERSEQAPDLLQNRMTRGGEQKTTSRARARRLLLDARAVYRMQFAISAASSTCPTCPSARRAMPRYCLDAGTFEPTPQRPALPDSARCPPILSRYSWIGSPRERAVECCTGHRQHAVRTHRFKACDASPPTLADVLSHLKGKTVSFVGDSTMHQLWTALVAEPCCLS